MEGHVIPLVTPQFSELDDTIKISSLRQSAFNIDSWFSVINGILFLNHGGKEFVFKSRWEEISAFGKC